MLPGTHVLYQVLLLTPHVGSSRDRRAPLERITKWWKWRYPARCFRQRRIRGTVPLRATKRSAYILRLERKSSLGPKCLGHQWKVQTDEPVVTTNVLASPTSYENIPNIISIFFDSNLLLYWCHRLNWWIRLFGTEWPMKDCSQCEKVWAKHSMIGLVLQQLAKLAAHEPHIHRLLQLMCHWLTAISSNRSAQLVSRRIFPTLVEQLERRMSTNEVNPSFSYSSADKEIL